MNERTHRSSVTRRAGAPASDPCRLSRVGVTGVEKVDPHPLNGRRAALPRGDRGFVDLNPQQKGAHMSRFEEIVNEAIDEVVLGEALKAETLAVAHRRARARTPGRPARRGDDHGALSRAQAGAGVRPADAGDLRADRLGGRVRARHAPAGGRGGPGHDGLPLRPGAVGTRSRERLRRRRLHRRRDRAHLRARARRHPQPARPRHAARRLPRGLRAEDRGRAACSRSSRSRCAPRSTS